MRIYALARKNRVLGGVALVLSMAPFIINAVGTLLVSFIGHALAHVCNHRSRHTRNLPSIFLRR